MKDANATYYVFLGIVFGVLIGFLLFGLISESRQACIRGAIAGYDLVWSEEYFPYGGCLVKATFEGNPVLLTIEKYNELLPLTEQKNF